MAHEDSCRKKNYIVSMHMFTARILDVRNAFQNMNVPIHEIVCVNPPSYYLDWFEKFYPIITLNLHDRPFGIQCMNDIQG